MQFVGTSFCADETSLDHTAVYVEELDTVVLSNAIYDTLHISRDTTSEPDTSIPDRWMIETILHAKFQDNLSAGNVNLQLDQLTHIRVARREKGEFNWLMLFEQPINGVEDVQFVYNDRLQRSNTTYEYALVPMNNGVEGNYSINEVDSSFDGIAIVGRDVTYIGILNPGLEVQHNQTTAIVSPLARRYPLIIKNAAHQYDSGTVRGTYVKLSNCEFDLENGWKWREEFNDFMFNGDVKLLKHFDGRMWLCMITDVATEDSSLHYQMPITTYNWTEVGEAESGHTLYINGFIDVDAAS